MKVLPVSSLLLLSACVSGVPSASLAPRAIEQRGEDITIGATTIAPPADAGLAEQIATLAAAARAGDTAFAEALPLAERTVAAARGAAPSSEPWIAAQQALSALESARTATATAVAELDALYIARSGLAATTPATGGVAELMAARDAAVAVADQQSLRLKTLADQINPG